MTASFANRLLKWFDQHGRHDLPWQKNPTPYRVWISEIMLQQTQVTTVIPYYQRFMQSFPKLDALANASQDQVLAHWAGLGYYARARNLHKSAQIIQFEYQGKFPDTQEGLEALPGIGRSTAGAIRALAMQQHAVILDGNVKRVLCRHNAIEGWPGKSDVLKKLWQVAEQVTPKRRVADYTQAIMDLGATLCTLSQPQCSACPLNKTCVARQQQNPTAYPGKKPRKAKPQRTETLLILCNDLGEFQLIRRPEKGIWGGLWSFPVLPEGMEVSECLAPQGFKAKAQERLPNIKHQFTHFDLHITPIKIEVTYTAVQESDPTHTAWIKPSGNLPGGTPAPITRLIAKLAENA